jgi:hypothetical protein
LNVSGLVEEIKTQKKEDQITEITKYKLLSDNKNQRCDLNDNRINNSPCALKESGKIKKN